MLQEFRIKNYKCFNNTTIGSLKRVNLFAGRNNVGKTALLEALFLFTGHHNPELPGRVNAFRGITQVELSPEGLWGWLFPDKDVRKEIELSASVDGNRRVCLRIALKEPTDTQLTLSELMESQNRDEEVLSASTRHTAHLVLECAEGEEIKAVAESWIEKGAIRNKRADQLLGDVFFLSTIRGFVKEDAKHFSKLNEVGQDGEVLEVLKIIEPQIRRLSVLVLGGVPVIGADIGLGRLIPVPYVGQGTASLLSMALAILPNPQGVVLIDEFENGLHYSILKNAWKAVGAASKRSGTQLFITTHSSECIKAAYEAFRELEDDDFCLQRLERHEDQITSVVLDRETLETAFAAELEIR